MDELAQMEQSYHLTLLEAVDHGVVLLDDGTFAAMRARHEQRKVAGALVRGTASWKRRPDLDPFASST